MAHIRYHILEGFSASRHLETDIEALLHSQFLLNLRDASFFNVQGNGGSHFLGEFKTAGVHVSGDDIARARVFCDRRSHKPNGTGTCNQHIFPQNFKGQGSMGSITKWIENTQYVHGHARISVPDVRNWNTKILGKSPWPLHPYAIGSITEVATPSQTVAAPSTHNMPFTNHDFPDFKIMHVSAYGSDLANEFMTDGNWNGYCVLRPCIPIPNVYIRAADRRLMNLNQDVVGPDFGNRYLFQP